MNQFAKPGLAEEKLPPVGSTDNGKVLGVSEGAWAKIAAPSGLPEVGADDKDKYLHTNASTGEPEWASGGGSGGGGVLVVTYDMGATDKTWQEIYDAMMSGGAVLHDSLVQALIAITSIGHGKTYFMEDASGNTYIASSSDDVLQKDEE